MQIKSIAGNELWSSDHETTRDTVVAAVEAGANLARADLAGARLRDGGLIERQPLQISGLR